MTLCLCTVSFSQVKKWDKNELEAIRKKSKKEIDSFIKIDFLTKKYQFLDKDFKINIDSSTFNKAVKKYNYYPERITSYRDSLSVVLTYELQSFHGSRIAGSRITYQWKKIGYYIWENEQNSKNIGISFGFKNPYRFYEFLIDNTIEDKRKTQLLKQLKVRISKLIKDSISIKPNKKFLKFAFKNNPQRKKDMEAYRKLKTNHKH